MQFLLCRKECLVNDHNIGLQCHFIVTSGVPQGSVLGPDIFLLYINDCPNGLSCDAVMFADDVKIWRTIESPSDVQSLQNDVDYLSSWSQGALMSFNTHKCVVLRLHPRQAKDKNV